MLRPVRDLTATGTGSSFTRTKASAGSFSNSTRRCGLLAHDMLGVIVTAPGDEVDFVSRFFAPRAGIFEDPVTGSAHCVLTPYWAQRLDKSELSARQISRRTGVLRCTLDGERVRIAGGAVLYLEGEITIR